MSQRIAALIASPAQARSMGEQGKKVALERYTAERYVQGVVDIYNRLQKERRHSP